MPAVGFRGDLTVLVLDGDAGAAAEGALAVERADEGAVSAIEVTAADALDRLADGDADCLVVTDAVPDADPVGVLARARRRFRGPIVFAPREGDERTASDAVAAGADEYVPLRSGEGLDPVREGALAERVGAALDEVRDRRRVPYRDLFEDAPAGVAFVHDGVVVGANDRFRRILGDGVAETPLVDVVPADDRDGVRRMLSTAREGGDPERVGVGGPDHQYEATLYASGLGSGVAVLAHDVADRRGRERRLVALHRTTREMVRSGSPGEIAELTVEAAIETLDPLAASAYVYDRDAGDLRREAAASGVVSSEAASLPDSEDRDAFAWDAFVAGELRRGADPPSVPTRVAIPLGDHGVLVVTGETADGLGDPDVEFARTLATNAEAALEAAHRDAALQERTERLRERTATLEGLRRIDSVVRDIGQLLVGATDRSEIERAVCDRLAVVEGWSAAWIGERRVAGEGLAVRAHSGGDRFLDAVRDAAGFEGVPADTALDRGARQYVEDLVAHPGGGQWREIALEYGHQSVVSIPLIRDGREYGVLEVYGDGTDAFGDSEREVLAELGRMVAYAVHAAERERALMADSGPEVAVETSAVDSFFGRLANEVGADVTVDGVVPQSDGDHLAYLAVEVDREDLAAAVATTAGRSRQVREFRAVGEGSRFEVRLSSAPLVDRVLTHGGRIRELTAGVDRTEARIELPTTVDVREFVEALRESFGDLEVTARRTAAESAADARAGVAERLTDRQREVLAVAYHSGFFEWPRESTGEAVADSLDIAAPTFHKHVRAAERKLLSAVLAGPDS